MSLFSGLFDGSSGGGDDDDIFSSAKKNANDEALKKRKRETEEVEEERARKEEAIITSLTVSSSTSSTSNTSTILSTMHTYGLAVIKDMFSAETITSIVYPTCQKIQESLEEALIAREINYKGGGDYKHFSFAEAAGRQRGRVDSRLGLSLYGAGHTTTLDLSMITGNPNLENIVKSLLGDTATLTYAGLIFSFPGSEDQAFHQDGTTLFPENPLLDLPSYAINVFIPVHALSRSLGLTEFFPGSHNATEFARLTEKNLESEARDGATIQPLLSVGDAMIYDYRTCHRGVANTSGGVRTMLYLMYSRPWFKEHLNFDDGESLFTKM